MVTATMNESEVEIDDTDTATSPQADNATLDQSSPPAERLDLPLSTAAKSTAAVYVRQQPYDLGDEPLDSSDPAPTRYESIGLFNGEQVFHCKGFTSRKFAIEDAAAAIAHAAATLAVDSKKKAHKLAAKELNNLLTAVENIASADGEDIPAGEECEWPGCAEVAGEQAGDEQADGETDGEADEEQTADAGLAGGEEISAAERNRRGRELAEAQFNTAIAALERNVLDAMLYRTSIDAQLKSAKAHEKELLQELQAMKARGPRYLPLIDGAEVKADKATPLFPASPSEGAAGAMTAHAAPPTPDAWRATPIDALGLPPKLTEKLVDSNITTIGALEDLRGSRGGLSSIKGIGPAKITLIEDAVMGWLTESRDAAVFAGVRDGGAGRAVGSVESVESVESPAAAEDPDAKAFE